MSRTPRAQDAVPVGQTVLGKYRIERVVGTGGMGVVAECTHLALDERVALKMLRQDIVVDHDTIERFTREAQAAAKLKSEYVARVFDVGALENGTPFMVMEFLEGHDLGDILKERGTLPVPWATQLILQTCEALAEAHSIGIVHRDVKPTNLFVTWRPDGSSLIKVLDFGISKATSAQDMHLTQTQSLLGTPAYMSPEQMRSARNVDARTDIWSLGTVLYELLEGRKPFEAESFSEMCVKVAVDPPAPMLNAPQVAHVVMRCLAKTPEQRYASMAELARDLVPYTQDPQQAAVSVERMQRMLRRIHGDAGGWEGQSTGVNARLATPLPIRDVASAPVRMSSAAGFGAGTDPSGIGLQPWHGGSEPSGPAFRPTPFPPTPMPHEQAQRDTTAVGRKRGGGWMVLALLLLAGAGAALAFGLLRSDEKHEVSSRPEPSTTPAPTPPAPTPTPNVVAPPTPTPTGDGSASQTATETPIEKPIEKPIDKPTEKPTAKAQPKIVRPKVGGTRPKVQPKVEPKIEPKVQPKVEPKCDPFANSHNCNSSK